MGGGPKKIGCPTLLGGGQARLGTLPKLTGFFEASPNVVLESFSPSCQITSMPGAILPDSAPIKIKNGFVSVSHLSKCFDNIKVVFNFEPV